MKKQSWASNVKPVYSGFSALHNSVLWKCALAVANLTVGIATLINPAFAQSNIVPDNTLGSEASRVIFNSRGTPNEAIEGGAQRGQNLFHSFEEFNVSQNRGAYFFVFNPNIQNIFARVTGSNRSDILGFLGTRQIINGNLFSSNANLFLMNPNGIVFGENAILDINGSFYATTANEIQFGNQGNFSTINPQVPRALTVNPSALFFDAVAKQGEIVNRSIPGLEVLPGKTLGLVGGNIFIEGGALLVPSGRIELGSVAPNSLVNITPRDTAYSLSYEGINNFQDILLSQAASVSTTGNSGGAVQVQGRNVAVTGGSSINANLTGNGVGQGLTVNASESVQVIGENAQSSSLSALRVQVSTAGTGKGGDMTINTPTLIVKDGAQISTGVFGAGKGGNLNVNVSNKIQLTGTTVNGNFASGLFSETLATGDAGNIGITTTELVIQNGARVNSSTRAFGQGGNINIGADTIEITGFSKNEQYRSFLGSETSDFDSSANAGNVNLTTRILNVRDGALVSTDTFNQGQAGDLTITARESLNISGALSFANNRFFRSALSTLTRGSGTAGNLRIVDTGTVRIEGGAGIFASSFGEGNGGNIEVNANRLDLFGISEDKQFASALVSETRSNSSSTRAGSINIFTNILNIKDGASISTRTFNQGRGGDLNITARESVNIAGTGTLSNGQVTRSGLFTTTSGSGAAGNIKILDTGLIQMQNGGQVLASTLGLGKGGTIDVTADKVDLEGISSNQIFPSGFGSETSGIGSSANAGDVTLTTKILNVRDGARISTESFNQGQAGNLTVSASESLNITGIGIQNNNTVSSGLFTSTRNSGAAGNLRIFNTGLLKVQDGGIVRASTLGQGQGGNLEVDADIIEIAGISNNQGIRSFLGSETTGIGSSANAGDLTLTARVLNILDGGLISTRTFNQGKGGDLNITARESINVAGTATLFNGQPVHSGLITLTSGSGAAGNLKIFDTGLVKIQDGGSIETSTFGQGRGGNIEANADTIELVGVSSNGIFASFLGSETRNINSSANAGDITLSTRLLNIRDGALISTQTFNQGRGGDLSVTARESINIAGTGTLSNGRVTQSGLFSTTSGSGAAGNIKIFDTGLIQMQNGGQVLASTLGLGKGGTINVTADKVDLEGISSNQRFPSGFGSETSGIGSSANAGDVTLATRILNIRNGARVSTESFNQGQAGNLAVSASESLNITGIGIQNNNAVGSSLLTSTQNSGAAGNLRIVNTGLLKVQNGGRISTSTSGQGRGGNIDVIADTIDLVGLSANGLLATGLASETTAIGSSADAGNITLTTRLLNIQDGALISTQTFNQGRGGDLNVTARESINVAGTATLFNGQPVRSGLITLTSGSGTAGNLKIFDTGLVKIQNGGAITASTFGQGSGGNINVNADTIDLVGLSENSIFSSFLGSETTGINSSANAGNVTLTTRLLNISDGALISTQTSNQGKGGDLNINARESINIAGTATLSNGLVTRSGLFTTTSGSGAAGNIKIFDTGFIQMQNGGQVLASTSGLGKGGTINVTADKIDLEGISTNQIFPSGFGSETSLFGSSANAGDITLATRILNIRNGARISTESFNQGQAGNLTVSASESLNITGIGIQNNNAVSSGLFTSTRNSGAAGNLRIFNTGHLKVQDGGRVSTSTSGQGRSGNIDVTADTFDLIGFSAQGLLRSVLESETTGIGSSADAGNITLTTRLLNIRDGALISTRTSNQGKGGDLNVTSRESINVTGSASLSNGEPIRSALITLTSGSGAAGNLKIFDTGLVKIENGGAITASTFGQGRGGNIDVIADSLELEGVSTNELFRSFLGSETAGIDPNAKSGNVNLTTRILNVRDGALISSGALNQGQGGNLTVTARESLNVLGTSTVAKNSFQPFYRSALSTQTRGFGAAGNLNITDTGQLVISDGAGIFASTSGQGNGGNINITADSLDLKGISTNARYNSFIGSETAGIDSNANAGDIKITTRILNVNDGALISTETSNQGRGGNLAISARESMNFIGTATLTDNRFVKSGLSVQTRASGSAGNLRIFDTGAIQVKNGALISTISTAQGNAGNIDISADSLELLGFSTDKQFRSALSSETIGKDSSGNAGNITLKTRNLSIRDGALISTETFNQGRGGNLTVTAAESLQVSGAPSFPEGGFWRSALSTLTQGTGKAGNLEIIDTGLIKIEEGAGVFASSIGQGKGGNINIAADFLELRGSSTDGEFSSFLGSETTGINSRADAGDITIAAGNINIFDGAFISTQTLNQGKGGNLTVTARESLNIFGSSTQNGKTFNSGLYTSTSGLGAAGNIKIFDTNRFVTASGGQVSASSSGLGQGGNIEVNADTVELIGFSSNNQAVSAFASETFGKDSTANAGDIRVTSRILNIRDGALISTQTLNQGKGGNLTVTARESLNIFGTAAINGNTSISGLFTSTSGLGAAGNIKIFDTNRIVMNSGGQVSASSSGFGQGGNIEINADTVDLIGFSSNNQIVSAFASETFGKDSIANAGDIKVTSRVLNIRDGARISTQTFNQGRGGNLAINARESLDIVGTGIQNEQVVGSGLFTITASFGAAGNIKIFDTELLTIKDGGQIVASTFGQGQGGNIEVSAGNVEILGISSNGQFTSAVGSETAGANSSADAGDVTLTARNLNIRDRGLISTRSFNQGKAGNININVDKTLNLTNGNILNFSRQSSGGSVSANAERIRLFGDSNISTSVVNGIGGGGDIKLTAKSILAFGDSDILAFAQDGRGGNITFNTPAFFGQNYRAAPPGTNPLTLEENNRVDINANAAVPGVIVLPDTSFVRNNLDELPEDAINTNALIANSCIARRNQQNGSFFVTGSGGLPARPSDAPLPSYSTGDVQPIPTQESAKLPTQKRRWQIGDPVTEPSGVYELPNGKLALGREC